MARAVAGQGRRPDETSSAEALLEQTIFGITFGPDDVKWLWPYEGVLRHETDDQNRVFFIVGFKAQVMENPACFAHAAGGQNDGRVFFPD